MAKCGVCGADVKEQPRITSEGKCSICGAKLCTFASKEFTVVFGVKF
jgi:hypothetical protein